VVIEEVQAGARTPGVGPLFGPTPLGWCNRRGRGVPPMQDRSPARAQCPWDGSPARLACRPAGVSMRLCGMWPGDHRGSAQVAFERPKGPVRLSRLGRDAMLAPPALRGPAAAAPSSSANARQSLASELHRRRCSDIRYTRSRSVPGQFHRLPVCGRLRRHFYCCESSGSSPMSLELWIGQGEHFFVDYVFRHRLSGPGRSSFPGRRRFLDRGGQ
jgi:hypothetical protein